MGKPQTCARLTPQATKLLAELAETMGVSKTAVIEMAIRSLARRINLPSDPLPPSR